MQPFQQIPHTADLAIIAQGCTLPELFINAMKGMFAVIEPQAIPHTSVQHNCSVQGKNREQLLVNFLSECLYLSDVHNEAYTDGTITSYTDTHLTATITGSKIQGFEVVEIKAVTYHNLQIEQKDSLWQATIVFDI